MSSTDTQGPHISDEQIAQLAKTFDLEPNDDITVVCAVLALAQPEASPTSAPVLAERESEYDDRDRERLDRQAAAYWREFDGLASPPAQEPPAVQEPLSEEDRAIIAAVIRELDDEREGNAPGHAHTIPGIWDDDNKPHKAGKPCAWCMTWTRFKRLVDEAGRET